MEYLLFLLVGLIIGSFLSSLTYSIEKAQFSFKDMWRRSECPLCGREIEWRDNIPLLSFFLLGGKCRNCKKKISLRYPALEIATGAMFVLLGWKLFGSIHGVSSVMSEYWQWLGVWTLPFFLITVSILLAIAVIDIEHQIIPDAFVFPLLTLTIALLIIFSPSPILFTHLFWGALASNFLLLLHFVTRGRGMGLGDVTLALFLGFLLGQSTWLALFLAFVLGAIVGLLLLAFGRAHWGRPIPFGPFLILGTFLALLFGERIVGKLGIG